MFIQERVLSMTTLQVEVEDGLVHDAKRLFPHVTDVEAKVAAIAFQEWVGWLRGSERPMTISEQNIQRIISIYSEILKGEKPDTGTLYNKFNFPLGQSRYIIQAISYREAGLLYRMALEDIRAAIEAKMVSV